jgi:hypothetical protein
MIRFHHTYWKMGYLAPDGPDPASLLLRLLYHETLIGASYETSTPPLQWYWGRLKMWRRSNELAFTIGKLRGG